MKIRGRGRSKNTIDNAPLSLPRKWVDSGAVPRTYRPPDAVRDLLRASLSKASQRAYRSDLRHFLAWGGMIPSTPEQISLYLSHYAATMSVATLSRRLATLAKTHTVQGLPNPVATELVRMTMRGIRRTYGRQQRRVSPIKPADLMRIAKEARKTIDYRDRALLLMGFAGAFRRSELVALNVEDVAYVDEGVLVALRRSKTDQEGAGRSVAIPYARGGICAVRALQEWLEHAGIDSGPLFRPVTRSGRICPERLTPQSVALIVKRHARLIGLDPGAYAGHSLRAGFATGAAKAGAPLHKIAAQTGHRSHAMLMRYVRDADLFADHPLREMF